MGINRTEINGIIPNTRCHHELPFLRQRIKLQIAQKYSYALHYIHVYRIRNIVGLSLKGNISIFP
jgi:hypothetical protein